MIKKIKKIFNKEGFNHSEGYVNPLEYHSIVYFVIKNYGVLDEFVPPWSDFLLGFMLIYVVSTLVFCALALYHGYQILDAAALIEAGTYTITISFKLWILSCAKLNVPDFHVFMRILRADFKYVCTDGIKYRERFFKNQLLTWKICLLVALVMVTISIGMVASAILSLIYYLLTQDPGSEEQKPLLFPFWAFELDFNKSPIYDIAFVYSDIYVLVYTYNYIFMIVTEILWIRQIATKADLVIWGLQDLLVDVHSSTTKQETKMFYNIIKYRMRAIIKQHQSMYDLLESYSRVYKKLLMFEQTCCGPVSCLTAYTVAKELEDGNINYMLGMLCVASIIVSFVPSYLCTFLRTKVTSVLDACWDTPFWNAGPVVRPYLVLIIQRSLRPLPIKFGGFQEVSLQTFSNKMASAYSCFNMLRQAFK